MMVFGRTDQNSLQAAQELFVHIVTEPRHTNGLNWCIRRNDYSVLRRGCSQRHTKTAQNGTFGDSRAWYGNSMKKSDLTAKQKLFVPCPVCAAVVGEHCRMYSGFGVRNEAHSERKYFAMQAIEHDCGRSFKVNGPGGEVASETF